LTDIIVLTEKGMNNSFTSGLYTTDLTWRCIVSHLLVLFYVLQKYSFQNSVYSSDFPSPYYMPSEDILCMFRYNKASKLYKSM